jgi:hypothetical protein
MFVIACGEAVPLVSTFIVSRVGPVRKPNLYSD